MNLKNNLLIILLSLSTVFIVFIIIKNRRFISDIFYTNISQEPGVNIMTIEEMKKLVQKHADLEEKHDIEGVLKTLVENPVYEIYPAGLKLESKENVKAFYLEHFNSFFPLIASFKLINEWWNPESACLEYDLFLKAPYAEKPYRILVILTAKNNLLLGERFYISDDLARIFSGTAFNLWKKF